MNALRLTVDVGAAEPPYEQVRAQLAGLIARGALAEGDRLPTVRALAADLGIAVNTVARAYKELEAEGLVTTGRRAGTTVAPGATPRTRPCTAARRPTPSASPRPG